MQKAENYLYITINSKKYSRDEVFADATLIDKPLRNFLLQWWNNSSFITVQTSGSTGTPKKMEVPKSALIVSASKTLQFFDLKPDMTALLALPLDFIAGKMMVVRALVGGLNLISTPVSGLPLGSLKEQIDFAALTPMQMMNELEQVPNKLSLLKLVIIGGGKVSKGLDNRLQRVDFAAFETYGMTETLSHVALRRINGVEREKAFTPLSDVHLSVDGGGCLLIDFKGVTDGLIATNDLVNFNRDGSFSILGRVDNIINSGGIKISPENVEAKLDGVIEVPFIISALPHDKLGEQLIIITEGAVLNRERVFSKISKQLSKFEHPAAIYSVQKMSRTESGKIRRKETLNLLKKELNITKGDTN